MDAQHYINGQLLTSGQREIANVCPADGKQLGTIPEAGAEVVEQALTAARRAQPAWSELPSDHRAHWLNALADVIEQNTDQLAKLEAQDAGKPVALAKGVEIPRAVANLRFFAAAATQFASEAHAMSDAVNYTLREPLGVVAAISPWNLPLYLFTWKIAPALAAGNAVVGKPSELTPLTATRLGELASSIDFPAGVLNIVHGTGPTTGQALVNHEAIDALTFTGGSATGKHLAQTLAPRLIPTSFELGGKNAMIVAADANLEMTARIAASAGFQNQGQICLCMPRILVHESIMEPFSRALAKEIDGFGMGDPRDQNTRFGALISAAHRDKVSGYLQQADASGATFHRDGREVSMPKAGGFYLGPSIISGLASDHPVNQAEIFGPVVSLQSFDTDAKAIQLANGVEYGLAACVMSENLGRAHRLARSLEAGIVWVNCWLKRDLRTPFGGVKQSGLGREGGFEAMRFFTTPKNVCIDYGDG